MYFVSARRGSRHTRCVADRMMDIITWILCAGVSTLGLSVALNAVSRHATCSVVFGQYT